MKEIAKVKLHIQAGKATPAPPIGPALAQHGINIGDFCTQFNDKSREKMGYTIPVIVTIFEDRSFSFELKSPLTSELIKKEIGIEKGSGEPNRKKVGKITRKQLEKVAQQKMPDLNTTDINKAVEIVAGTAKNMGVEVVD